ncbi:hypothetical protein ACQEVS_10925 [Streptomyces sp. CA-181903]|uniref:hypothetical protein n=1 Tax=Streptomyces sp. CA-181903 TaxID=3240055 RepID=UPI003D8A1B74
MRLLPGPTAPTAPATGPVFPCVRLTLDDGPERLYLLDDPHDCPAAMARGAVYDPYVHLAYLLIRQGHDVRRLARFTGLPLSVVHRVAEAAALTRP